MKKRFTLKNSLYALLALLIIFQFFRIDKTNPPVDPSADLVTLTSPPAEITTMLKASCYDCHSNETVYPWYMNVAPISWWTKHHINDGRRHLNFSIWGSYSAKKADHKLEECVEMVEKGEMPMTSYTLMHSSGKLTKDQQAQLISWFNSLRTHASEAPNGK